MYVTFPVSQREFLRAQESGHQVDVTGIKVRLRFADGTIYDQIGRDQFRRRDGRSHHRHRDGARHLAKSERRADRRPAGAGRSRERHPGQEKVVVPQAALIADQEGVYVFVVEDGKAVVRRLKLGGESGTDVVVAGGPVRRRAGHRRRTAGRAPRRAGAGDPAADRRRPELSRCSPPFSSTGRGSRSSSRSSPRSPACWRCSPSRSRNIPISFRPRSRSRPSIRAPLRRWSTRPSPSRSRRRSSASTR